MKIVSAAGTNRVNTDMHKWFVYKEFEEAAKAAADFLASSILACIEKNDICHVILSGGNTPPRCLAYLVTKALPWDKVHWYPGDERCVPRGHADRNDVMLEQYLWSQIGTTNVHTMPTELGAEKAAVVYRDIIRDIEHFDIAFLGMGEDGHTASLFPGNAALDDPHSVVPVYNSPKPPRERVSLSMDTLRKTSLKMVLAGGETKADVIQRIKAGEQLPINCLGDIHWYIDKAAASKTLL